MTTRTEIDFENDKSYVPYLDHGFVGLVDTMGTDSSIVQAARVSYGDGTKSARDDRGLIRYLVRHKHTSPLEMVELKFHLKVPIFVMRQHVRHRTANLNEWSGRYSVMTDEFYIPEAENLKPQSTTNKQGRGGEMSSTEASLCQRAMEETSRRAYEEYQSMLNVEALDSRQGLSRELARIVLPLNNYTELYWKIDLHNFFHFTKLRKDSHAQWEIQQLASLMYDFAKEKFPVACEAFEDYIEHSVTLSRMEVELMSTLLDKFRYDCLVGDHRSEKGLADKYNMSERELKEFAARWGL